MDEPGFFSKARVIIVGLGLMGGSLALALKDKVAWLGGIDTSQTALKQAASLKIFDTAFRSPRRPHSARQCHDSGGACQEKYSIPAGAAGFNHPATAGARPGFHQTPDTSSHVRPAQKF